MKPRPPAKKATKRASSGATASIPPMTQTSITSEGVLDTASLPSGPTGRYLVTFRDVGQAALARTLRNVAGLSPASTGDFENASASSKLLTSSNALIFEHLGVAVVDADPRQLVAIESAVADNENPIVAVEPEEYVHALMGDDDEPQGDSFLSPSGMSYLRGYQDGIAGLIAGLTSTVGASAEAEADITATYGDTATLTWGLQATLAAASRCNGSGIRIAVLDTGFDLTHPDFAGRSPITASFVPGEAVQDGHGHGTHCIGTACGALAPSGTARRYGVATNATILACKVLSNAGSGQDSWILAGINWAIQNKATIISMSLGAPVPVGGVYKQAYEQAAQAALNAGTLIVAAAGNDGALPVNSPANCPSILAVAAVDPNLQRAGFSCIGINPNGGEVDIAAPGVAVYSSTRMPAQYATWGGTSMATPHVAGCAALWAQSTGLRGKPLWNRLISSARAIGLPAQHAGAGLVQAPPCSRPGRMPPIRRRFPIPFPIR